MLKKAGILLVSFQIVNSFAGTEINNKDSFVRKNLIEWGSTCVNLFNRSSFVFTVPTSNYYLSYARVFSKYHFFSKADYHSYSRANEYVHSKPIMERGDIAYTIYKVARVSIGKIWVYKKFRLAPYLGIDYRWGLGDLVFWEWVGGWEPVYGTSPYKSYGASFGGSVNYVIKNRLSLGFETHFDQFFQKNNLMIQGVENPKEEASYRPNNRALSWHFNIGFLF